MSNMNTMTTREARHQELLEMFKDRHQQSRVLRLYHQSRSPEETLEPGTSIIEVILDREFGAT